MVKSLETKDYIVDGNGRKLYPVSILDIKEEVDDLKQSSASKTYVNKTVKKAIDDIDIEQYITEEEIQKAVKDLALDDYAKKEDLEDYAKKSDTVNKSTYNHEMEIMNGKIQNVSAIEMDLDRRVEYLEERNTDNETAIGNLNQAIFDSETGNNRIEMLENEVFDEDGQSKIAQIESNIEGMGTQVGDNTDKINTLQDDYSSVRADVDSVIFEVFDSQGYSRISENEGNIESLKNEVYDQDGNSKIDQMESNIEGLGMQLGEHADRLDSLSDDISELSEAIEPLMDLVGTGNDISLNPVGEENRAKYGKFVDYPGLVELETKVGLTYDDLTRGYTGFPMVIFGYNGDSSENKGELVDVLAGTIYTIGCEADSMGSFYRYDDD